MTRRALAIVLALVLGLALGSRGIAGPGSGSGSGSGSDDEDEDTGSAAVLVAPKPLAARKTWLHDRVAAAIAAHPTLGKAKLGIAIADVGSGTELYAQDADVGMNLASTTKLLTSVAALATLGGGFRWRTAIYADDLDDATGVVKGDLYVRGRGDPTLTEADLRALADDVAARGVRKVNGALVIDGAYFDGVVEPPHFDEQPKERAGFRAPVASFGVAKSAVDVVVTAEPGGSGTVRLEPEAGDYVRLGKTDVKTIATGRTRIKVDVKPKQDHLEIDVTGQIRAQDGSYDVRRRVDDPQRFAAEVLRAALAARGVTIGKRKLEAAPVPAAAKLVAAHDSAPLSVAVREMDKQSDNYVAESVYKTLGAETRATPGPATWADGTAAVAAALAKLGIAAGSYRADNGSGLYSASAVSAHQLVRLLVAAHQDFRIGPDLVAAFPVGGVDGTLAKRWHGRTAQGRVRAKTGTLDKVTSLCGFVAIDGGHPLAFAIVVNDIPAGQRGPSRAMADDIVDAMLAYLEAGS